LLKEEKLSARVHIYLVSKKNGSKQKETLINQAHEFTLKAGGTEISGFGAKGVSHERVKEALRSDGSLMVGCDIDFLPYY